MKKALTIKARIGISMAFLGALLIAIGALGLAGMGRTNEAFLDTYSVQMPGAIAVGNSEMYAARERLVFDRAALLAGTAEVAATIERSRMMRERADAFWKNYMSLPQTPDERRLADASQDKRLALQRAVDKGLAAVTADDRTGMIAAAKAMQAAYNELANANDALRSFLTEASKKSYEDAQSRYSWFRALSLSAIALGLAAAAFAWVALRRAIGRPLEAALAHFRSHRRRRSAPRRGRDLARRNGPSARRPREDARESADDGSHGALGQRIDRVGHAADRGGQHRSVVAHRGTGVRVAGNGIEHGGTDEHGAPERR